MTKLISSLCIAVLLMSSTASATEKAIQDTSPVDPIKKAEFLRQQHALFSKADKNFDGRVTHDEVLYLRQEQNRPKHEKAFKALDVDKNGFLSLREIHAKHEEFTEKSIGRLSQRKDKILKTYDLNGNGIITSQEIEAYFEMKEATAHAKTGKNAERDLKAKDTDGSGSVSLEEYLESKIKPRLASINGAAFQSLNRDINGDKIITRSENESFSNDFFSVLDKNKDDQLSVAEQSNKFFEQANKLRNVNVVVTNNFLVTMGDR